jgi:hypothetical protein
MASFTNELMRTASSRQSHRTTNSNKVNKRRDDMIKLCPRITTEINIYNTDNNYESYKIFMTVLANYPAQLERLSLNTKTKDYINSLKSSKSVMLKSTNLNLIINYLCENDLDKNSNFLEAFLEKITEANNPLNTVGQNSQNKTNNKSAKNNGAPAKNNGAPAKNNGTPAKNNGAPAKNNGGQTPRKNTTQKNGAPVRPIPAPRKNGATPRPTPAPRTRKNTTQKNGAPVRPIPAPRKHTAKTQNKTQIISQSKTRN